ncbi:MAG TPA: sialate O-acetylesterase [Candidatus Eisenbacteria bacterium]
MTIAGRVVSAGGGFRAYRPVWNAAPTLDPNSYIVSSSGSQVMGGGRLRITTQNHGSIGLLPNQMAIWESTQLADSSGRPVGTIDNMDLGDIIMPLIRAPNILAPTDVIIACGVSKGSVAAGNPGLCASLRDTKGTGSTIANKWTAGHGSATVGAWSMFASSNTDPNCIMGMLNSGMGTQWNQSKVNTLPLDVGRYLLTTAGACSSSGAANAVGEYDRVWIGFGFVTGVGGADLVNFDFGGTLLFARPFDAQLLDPFDGAIQGQPSNDASTVFLFGQSNCAGSHEDDTTFPVGSAVSANYTVIGTGVTYATWPAHSATDGVGPAPYLGQALVANGVSHPILVRRARTATGMQVLFEDVTMFSAGVADFVSLGKAPSHVVLIHGEEDSKTDDTANDYLMKLRRFRDNVRALWPSCRIIITKLRTTTYGPVGFARVQAAQAALVAETSNAAFVVTDGFGLSADAIHYSVGTGGGFDQLGQAIAAVW